MSKTMEYIALLEQRIEVYKKLDESNEKIIEADNKIIANQKKIIENHEQWIMELLAKIAVLEEGNES